MGRVSWVHGDGPLMPFAAGYRRRLAEFGYTAGSITNHLSVLGRLNRWLVDEGLGAEELTRARVEQLFAGRRVRGDRCVRVVHGLATLLDYLDDQQVLQSDPPPTETPLSELLTRYARHLVHDRGLAPRTVMRYERMARRFLQHRTSLGGGETGAEDLDMAEIHGYLLECRSRLAAGSTKREAADLRALLRFLYLQGFTATDLGLAMPPVAGWRDARLPATMSAAQVAAVLDSCDRSRPAGLRDFAVLCLLARLGLRSAEVAALQLTDVDWRAGELLVRGKARRHDRLPLTVEVGEAIAAYLHDGRPTSISPSLILTCHAPIHGISYGSIASIVYNACQRAGLARVGGHRLRHALAAEILRRGGGLVEIGQVLRHRDLGTTSVYAKLDRAALRTVAQPWPGAGR
jgi:site-specific recombinase XerD